MNADVFVPTQGQDRIYFNNLKKFGVTEFYILQQNHHQFNRSSMFNSLGVHMNLHLLGWSEGNMTPRSQKLDVYVKNFHCHIRGPRSFLFCLIFKNNKRLCMSIRWFLGELQ